MLKFFKSFKQYIKNPVTEIKHIDAYNIPLLSAFLVLLIGGCIMNLSVTPIMANIKFANTYAFLFKHFISVFLGAVLFFLIAFVFDYKIWQRLNKILFIIAIILLIAVVALGVTKKGATRWLDLGIMNFQPSEFAKIAVVVIMSDFLARKKNYLYKPEIYIMPLIYLISTVALVVMQKDLGTVVFLFATWMALMFVAGMNKLLIPVFGLCGIALTSVLVILQPYRIKRFTDYFNSVFDISLASSNVKSALFAFGAGGILGKGPGKSDMKLLHLPEMHTDFIFPLIGEEYGLLGTLLVILLFIVILISGFKITQKANTEFGRFLAFGITVMFALQAFVNMGMSTGVIPAKGMPLPFISYGGSSMIISMMMMGMLLNISRQVKK